MPGRLMVGRMALDHVVKVRVLPGQLFYRSTNELLVHGPIVERRNNGTGRDFT